MGTVSSDSATLALVSSVPSVPTSDLLHLYFYTTCYEQQYLVDV